MIRIAIVEDEKEYVKVLEKYLMRYKAEHNTLFEVRAFSDGLDIITDYTADYDIILLDIQMRHLDGMKTAEKIRALDENVIFIFITSTVQFAVQGYTVDALGYVLKPVSYLAFSQILTKAVKQTVKKQSKEYLYINIEGGHIKLDINQIVYIESQRHNILIHSEKGDFTAPGPMKRVEALLSPKGFSKCHKSYLVNLNLVMGLLRNDVQLPDKTELPISRARRKAFMEDLANYVGGTHL